MYNFEEVKQFLKDKGYQDKNYQVYNTRNIVGDPMHNVYIKDGVVINECTYYGYIEIFGITKEEYNSLWTGMHELTIK